jgi:hypothetical protein
VVAQPDRVFHTQYNTATQFLERLETSPSRRERRTTTRRPRPSLQPCSLQQTQSLDAEATLLRQKWTLCDHSPPSRSLQPTPFSGCSSMSQRT